MKSEENKNKKAWEEEFDEKYKEGLSEGPAVSDKLYVPQRVWLKHFIAQVEQQARAEGEAFKGKAKREAYQNGYAEARAETIEKIIADVDAYQAPSMYGSASGSVSKSNILAYLKDLKNKPERKGSI